MERRNGNAALKASRERPGHDTRRRATVGRHAIVEDRRRRRRPPRKPELLELEPEPEPEPELTSSLVRHPVRVIFCRNATVAAFSTRKMYPVVRAAQAGYSPRLSALGSRGVCRPRQSVRMEMQSESESGR
jgi:hypothetical protein